MNELRKSAQWVCISMLFIAPLVPWFQRFWCWLSFTRDHRLQHSVACGAWL